MFFQPLLQKLGSQKQKLDQIFTSSSIAYSELKEETGLLYLNLDPGSSFKKLQVKLVDKLGIRHQIDLFRTPFALQIRADNPFQALRLHLKHNDIDAAKNVVMEIVDCLKGRYQKGILDRDPALRRNIGLIKDRAIAIDIGSFFYSDKLDMQKELQDDTRRMRRWLLKRSPELTTYLDSLTVHCKEREQADQSL